jgi:hypothetical protein
LLVNSEIRHISGELENDAYDRECNVLSLGLDTTKSELDEIKEAVSAITGGTDLPTLHPSDAVEEAIDDGSDTEKRLEIVMDTETTTSIETSIEEQASEQEMGPIEEAAPPEDPADTMTEEEAEASHDGERESEVSEVQEPPEIVQEHQAEIPVEEDLPEDQE